MFKLILIAIKFVFKGSRKTIDEDQKRKHNRRWLALIGISIGVCIMGIFVMFLWALSSTGYLIEQGVFDKEKPEQPVKDPSFDGGFAGDEIVYDDITGLINKLDLSKIPDDLMPSIGSQYLLPGGHSAKWWLQSYLLISDICSRDEYSEIGVEGKVQPYMIYGVWVHEDGMQTKFVAPKGESITPFNAWVGRLYPTINVNGIQTPTTIFGQVLMTFGETSSITSSSTFDITPSTLVQATKLQGAGITAAFVSGAETNGDSFLLFDKDGMMDTSKIKFKSHPTGWSGTRVQRPSGCFIPDAIATVATQGNYWFSGYNYYSWAKSSHGLLDVLNSKGYSGKLADMSMLSSWFAQRAGKLRMYWGLNSDYLGGRILSTLMANSKSKNLEYFASGEFITEYGGGNAMRAFDATMYSFCKSVFGFDTWDALAASGGQGGSGGMLSGSGLAAEVAALMGTGVYRSENVKPSCDALYLYSSGTQICRAIQVLAESLLTVDEYRKVSVGDESGDIIVGTPQELGLQSNDKNFDGLCDKCKQSVFDNSTDSGCGHKANTYKMIWPIKGSWSILPNCVVDYHGAGLCTIYADSAMTATIHRNYAHEAYDIQAGEGAKLVAITDGYVMPYSYSATGYGYHTYLAYPSKDNPMYYFSYAHMVNQSGNEALVDSGGNVKAGTVIGTMGSTGNATGRHLHLRISTEPLSLGGTSINFFESDARVVLAIRDTSSKTIRISPYVKQLD